VKPTWLPPLAALWGEALGTFIMVLFGTGAVACAVLTSALQGLWQVAVVWGCGVALAIYVSAGLSGAHLNPAVTAAFALLRPAQFPRAWALPYAAAQLAGATAAGAVVLAVFGGLLARFEAREGLVRGAAGSERAAMIFGQYFPNPGLVGAGPDAAGVVSPATAVAVEALGTALLVLVIFALTDQLNPAAPDRALVPVLVGATVAALIAVFAPVSQAGWNPARDLGPRLVALLAGYGAVAIPGPQTGFWIYLVGPLVGGPLGGLLYDRGVRTHLAGKVPPGTEEA
jgi:glycerol uptake facilitator protein